MNQYGEENICGACSTELERGFIIMRFWDSKRNCWLCEECFTSILPEKEIPQQPTIEPTPLTDNVLELTIKVKGKEYHVRENIPKSDLQSLSEVTIYSFASRLSELLSRRVAKIYADREV